jgi:hypothetical protein
MTEAIISNEIVISFYSDSGIKVQAVWLLFFKIKYFNNLEPFRND